MWQKLWFEVCESSLSYYSIVKRELKGKIDLSDVTAVKIVQNKPNMFDIIGNKTYRLLADNPETAQAWVNTLSVVANGLPRTGITLANFRVIRLLGTGAFGKVRLVQFDQTQQLFAMKSMSKRKIFEYDQVRQVFNERDVLTAANHPFLVGAHFVFQTEGKVFMILDYCPGGDLFTRLREEVSLSESRARFYAAEILLGLEAVHSLGYVYRDLKPENVMITETGNVKLTDFGMAVKCDEAEDDMTFGTPEYVAPELAQGGAASFASDWWSFGVLLAEMMTGKAPFHDDDQALILQKIVTEEPEFDGLSEDAKDLLRGLLAKEPSERLGSGKGGSKSIRKHKFFANVRWNDLLKMKTEPEFIPEIRDECDTSHFNSEFTVQDPEISHDVDVLANGPQEEFRDFSILLNEI